MRCLHGFCRAHGASLRKRAPPRPRHRAAQARPRARQADRHHRVRRVPWRRRQQHARPPIRISRASTADYIAAQLAAFKSGARPSPIMQGMAAGLSPEDMRSVGAYFESPEAGAGRWRATRRSRSAAQQIWRGGIKSIGVPACAGCHGAAGHGIPAQYPRLAGQYSELTLGWLKAYATGARPHAVMGPIAAKLVRERHEGGRGVHRRAALGALRSGGVAARLARRASAAHAVLALALGA